MTKDSLHVSLLGPICVLRHGEPISFSTKQSALIARVFSSKQGRVTRSDLSDLLWPGVGPSSARHSLSQALYVVKKKCPGLLSGDPKCVAAPDGVFCDLVAFREAITTSDWVRASQFYTGPFLEGIDSIGSVAFSHWKDGVQESLTLLAEQVVGELLLSAEWKALEQLTSVLVRQGRSTGSVVSAHVASVFQRRGESAATNVIDQLPPGISDDARAFLQTVADSHHAYNDKPQPFVGREESLRWLSELYEEGVAGNPSIALVAGEAGIGKTALVNRYCRLLALKGAQILMAAAHSAEENVPFGIVEQWLRDISDKDRTRLAGEPWMAVIRKTFPTLRGETSFDCATEVGDIGYQRLVESLRRLLLSLRQRKPLVLGIDDLQHADSASLGLLHYLFRDSPVGPAVVVATVRTETTRDLIEVTEWGATKSILLEGLTVQEVRDWLSSKDIPPSIMDKAAESLHRRTGGNPLLVSALLDEGHLLADSDIPPQSIIDFYRPRILNQSSPAQRLLAAISLVGEPGAWEVLAHIAGLSDRECAQASRELEELNWIIVEGETLALRHSLLGQVAVSILSAVERKGFHGRAARVLAEAGRLPDAVAAVSHDVAGNREDAFEAAKRAADACETLHARDEKEFFLKLALSNAPSDLARTRVRIELGELHLKQGRLTDALEILDIGVVSGVPDEVCRKVEIVRLRVLAAMTGDVDVLNDLWDRARKAGNNAPALAVAETYTHIGAVAYDLGLDDVADEVAELIVNRLSESPPDQRTALRMLRPTAVIGFLRGYQTALDSLAKLPTPTDDDPVYNAVYHASKGTLLVAAGSLKDSERFFATSLGLTERFALFDLLHVINNNLGVCLMEQGRYDEAEARFDHAIKYAAETSPSQLSTAHDNLTILTYERSAYISALEAGSALLAAREVSGRRAVMSLRAIVGLSALEVGDLARCRQAEREIHVLMQRYGGYSNDMSYVHIFLARMMAFRKQPRQAIDSLADASRQYRKRNRLASLRIDIERCRLQMRQEVDCLAQLDRVLNDLEGSGATPMIQRARELRSRSTRHPT